MRALVRFVNHFHLKLRNMFHFFACHLISDSSSCFFLLSFFPLLIITTFHHSCVHHHHHHRLFAFHNNRDLKLIWMNIEFHALLQNVCVCVSNYERIIMWKFSFLLFFNISLLCISFKPFPLLPHLYKLMNWSHSLPAVTANSKEKIAMRFGMFIDKTKREEQDRRRHVKEMT